MPSSTPTAEADIPGSDADAFDPSDARWGAVSSLLLRDGPSGPVRLYAALRQLANNTTHDLTAATAERLAAEMCVRPRVVRNWLSWLIEHGWVVVRRPVRNGPNVWHWPTPRRSAIRGRDWGRLPRGLIRQIGRGELRPLAAKVYPTMNRLSDDDAHYCSERSDRLAAFTGANARSVGKAIAALVEHRWITPHGPGYIVENPPRSAAAAPPAPPSQATLDV